jgi:hypothetical protein
MISLVQNQARRFVQGARFGAAPRADPQSLAFGDRAPRRNSLALPAANGDAAVPPNRTRRASGFPRPFCLRVAKDCYCVGAVAAGAAAGLPVRRVRRRSWRLWRRSLRWLRRPFRRFAPGVPVASAGPAPVSGAVGFGTAGAASCASAADGASTPESAKPSVAPKPSRESIFRRETVSISTSLFPGFSSPARQSRPMRLNAG